ncbi:MAG: methylmalonyl-CoA mutase family protein [Acidobacteriota bacterium]
MPQPELPGSPFDAFDATDFDRWRQQVEEGLGGRSVEDKLAYSLPSGLRVQPLSSPGGAAAPVGGRSAVPGERANSWVSAHLLPGPTPETAREALEAELATGAEGFWLRLNRSARAGFSAGDGFGAASGLDGVALHRSAAVARLFQGIDLSILELWLEGGAAAPALAAATLSFAREAGLDLGALRGSLGLDPLGTLARFGETPYPLDDQWRVAVELIEVIESESPGLGALLANARPVHEAGGDRAQELAFLLASAVESLRQLELRGVAPSRGARQLRFAMAVDGELFAEIAKLRAARWLWAKALKAWSLDPGEHPARLHVATSRRTPATVDQGNNPVRTTVETFAAIVGGADAIATRAAITGRRSAQGGAGVKGRDRWLAANVQRVLREESRLDVVQDAGAGSATIEALTEGLARQAWELFQQIEGEGGLARSCLSGVFSARVRERAEQRRQQLGRGKRSVVGVSLFPPALDSRQASSGARDEAPDGTSSADAANPAANPSAEGLSSEEPGAQGDGSWSALTRDLESGVPLDSATAALYRCAAEAAEEESRHGGGPALEPVRDAEIFESLRQRAAERSGGPPRVLLVLLGQIKEHRPRQQFAESFFGAGGFRVEATEPLVGESWEDPAVVEALAKAWSQAGGGADVALVCFCGRDETYVEALPGLARRLKSLGARQLALAGAPGESEELFRKAGVGHFVHLRSHRLESLEAILSAASAA